MISCLSVRPCDIGMWVHSGTGPRGTLVDCYRWSFSRSSPFFCLTRLWVQLRFEFWGIAFECNRADFWYLNIGSFHLCLGFVQIRFDFRKKDQRIIVKVANVWSRQSSSPTMDVLDTKAYIVYSNWNWVVVKDAFCGIDIVSLLVLNVHLLKLWVEEVNISYVMGRGYSRGRG